ncbi:MULTISPECIES: TPM domain-containing protein [unclassified Bacillus (in: firmicutes)]|uniref:TPM domain-containing protein n=1 Tax=unclassified Bacillus (in: firmicutes) TaxID=185979 RepID=UPI001BE9E69B|nr:MULTISPECIES: TPM domain-containing protein [unclassified Bacillus (in: firmicutes)]MBT2637358.1 TPM domain-containing protein [Bacillus sp. ISL-39]MBT2660431.1 TPM domain-containing protein [Bacillus sp. ISL-45]
MSISRFPGLAAILGFLLLLLPTGAIAAQNEIPAPVGDIYVQDFANVLSENEKIQLKNIGRSIDDQTTSQIAVLTVDSIGESSIEEYSVEAYRKFGLGTKENDNGVLLVIAMQEKKIRIEVGYGLEGIVPDGKAGRILDEYAIPHLQNGQPNLAVMNTYQALANEVSGTNEFGSGPRDVQQQDLPIPSWLLVIIVIGVIVLDFMFFGGTLTYLLLSIISRGGGGGGPRGGGGGSSGGGGASRGW